VKTLWIALVAFFLVAPTMADFAVLADPAAAGAAPACPEICAQYLAQYCARSPNGSIHAVWTNPCLACRQHIVLLHRGACGGR